jgi:hypothetical protein
MPTSTEQAGRWRPIPGKEPRHRPDPTAHTPVSRRQTVGPIPTLPPNPQRPPTDRNQRPRRSGPAHDPVFSLDQPAAAASEPQRDSGLAMEEAAVRAHHELAEADRSTHPPEDPEPLGRWLPAPLEASRQGVER